MCVCDKERQRKTGREKENVSVFLFNIRISFILKNNVGKNNRPNSVMNMKAPKNLNISNKIPTSHF